MPTKIDITVREADVRKEGFWDVEPVSDNGIFAKKLSNTLRHVEGGRTTVLVYGTPNKKGELHLYKIDVRGEGSRGEHYKKNVALAIDTLRNISIKNRQEASVPLFAFGDEIVETSPNTYKKLMKKGFASLLEEMDNL